MSKKKIKFATAWLDGCSGCHMSFLDIDERILELIKSVDIVYSPLVDAKVFPSDVDVTIVEGAVSTDEDIEKIRMIRSRTKTLIALGDCAITGNVPAMRNPFGVKSVMERAYFDTAQRNQCVPEIELPKLLERVRPIHEVVTVDVFIPGCPPPADAIYQVLTELIEGKPVDVMKLTRFGK